MNTFDRGLRELADDAARAHRNGPNLPAAAIDRRARRIRHRHEAVLATASVAAAAALLLTGAALLNRPAPPQPALPPTPTATPDVTPTPTPTPTPTDPTPDVVTLPTGDATLPFGDCGSTVGSPASLPVQDAIALPTWTYPSEVRAGAPIEIRVNADAVGADPVLLPDAGPRLAVTLDGVVVATGQLHRDTVAGWRYYSTGDTNGLSTFTGLLDLAVCETTGGQPPSSAGRALPAGTYELRALMDAVSLPGAYGEQNTAIEDLLAWPGATHGVALGEPVTFTVSGTAEWPSERNEAPSSDLPAESTATECGSPVDAASNDGLLTLSYDASPRTAAPGDPVPLDATLTYVGPGRGHGYLATVTGAWVVRDGVVVGYSGILTLPSDGYGSEIEMGAGSSIRYAAEWSQWPLYACFSGEWPDEDPLAPGDYLLYPTVDGALTEVTLPDGTRVATDIRPGLGGPIQLTIR